MALSYCLKCKEKTDIVNPVEILTANNRKALTGTCKVCGTKKYKFLPSDGTAKKPAAKKSTKKSTKKGGAYSKKSTKKSTKKSAKKSTKKNK